MNPNDCSEDFIELTTPPHSQRGEGLRLCNKVTGNTIRTDSKRVFLYFVSNERDNERGFWIKYTGV